MSQSITLELDDETLQALDRLADRTELSRIDIVSHALRDYLQLQDWQPAKVQTGIEAADRGDFVREQEIDQIIQKYSSRK
jgi:predicted transcriptional regulator